MRFRLDGAIACRLFFIKTKQMRLRAMMSAAIQSTKAAQAAERLKAEADFVDPAVRLNAHMQRLYKEGKLGTDPYAVSVAEAKKAQEEQRKQSETQRPKRPPQHVERVLPVMRIDSAETDEKEAEAEESRRKRARESEVERALQGMGIGVLKRVEPWFLYPSPCTVAGEEALSASGVRTPAIDGGTLERVR